jgi:hypothetical protein
MATIIIPEIRGGYRATWTTAGLPFHRRLTGIHKNEVIIAVGNIFDGIKADY